MTIAIEDPEALRFARRWHGFHETFIGSLAVTDWTTTGEGTAVPIDGADGSGLILTPSTGTADNDEVYVHLIWEAFKFLDSRPLYAEFMLKYAQAATNKGNLLFGFMDAVAADALVDDGGGPKSSYSGAVFFAKDGNLNWHIQTSLGSTQTTVELTAKNSLDKSAHLVGQTVDQILRIEITPKASANDVVDVAFLIDGVVVYKEMDVAYGSATDMEVVMGAKNGSTADEKPTVRYSSAYQRRA